jgi:hypothetical protein
MIYEVFINNVFATIAQIHGFVLISPESAISRTVEKVEE